MRRSLIFSVVLHLSVLALALFGLPKLWDTPPPADTPLVVDVVTIDKVTRAANTPKPKPPEKKKPEKKEPPKPPVAKTPPPAPAPKPPEVAEVKPEKVPEAMPKPKPKKKKEVKKKEEPKAKTPPRQIARARPRRRPAPSREDFLKSVLRDVAPEERAEKSEKKAPDKAPAPVRKPEKTPVRRAPLDAQATMTEIDAIRRQIEGCWNIPAGSRDAENLVVSIRVWVNPDGKVAKAEILDRSRMGSDPFYRSAAESALRAVLNPRCSPLRFPPTKYDQFKVMVLNFNPKEATGS
jgi:outer membrane biosynthesis protein TonB